MDVQLRYSTVQYKRLCVTAEVSTALCARHPLPSVSLGLEHRIISRWVESKWSVNSERKRFLENRFSREPPPMESSSLDGVGAGVMLQEKREGKKDLREMELLLPNEITSKTEDQFTAPKCLYRLA